MTPPTESVVLFQDEKGPIEPRRMVVVLHGVQYKPK